MAVVLGDRVMLAGEAEGFIGETALQDSDRFGKASLADRRALERQPDRLVLGPVPAGADRHVEASIGQHVEAGEVLGQHRRMAQVVVEHESGDAQALGRGGDGRHGRDRGELRDEVVRDDEGVNAHRLRAAGRLGELPAADGGTRLGQKPKWLHAAIVACELPRRCRAASACRLCNPAVAIGPRPCRSRREGRDPRRSPLLGLDEVHDRVDE
jgi:hypothetical protein